MNIDKQAWAAQGQRTRFPAQVRVNRVQTCPTLKEKQRVTAREGKRKVGGIFYPSSVRSLFHPSFRLSFTSFPLSSFLYLYLPSFTFLHFLSFLYLPSFISLPPSFTVLPSFTFLPSSSFLYLPSFTFLRQRPLLPRASMP